MTNVLSAFSAEQVERLTGLSSSQLRDWDKAEFFSPAFAASNRRTPYSRIYSFEDLVGLRVLSILRGEHRISLPHLKDVARKLKLYAGKPWSELTLYVLNKEVHFKNPATGRVEGAVTGQYAALIPIANVVEDMRNKADALRHRSKDTYGKLERHRFVARNHHVIAGTRIPVEAVWSFADAGYSPDQIVEQYPQLTVGDVQTALRERKRLTNAA